MLVSLVMPVQRCKPEHFEKSLCSLLNQTYGNLEVIVILDSDHKGQDEPILHIIEGFKDDHRIRTIVRTSEKGFCSALNTGILHSSGNFVARLDSDDYSEPTRIEVQMDALHSSNAALAGTWAHVVNEQGKETGEVRTPVSMKSIRDLIMLHNPFVHSSVIFAKDIIKVVGLYKGTFEGAEDYEFYLRLISSGFSCFNVPQFLTILRQTTDSMTRGRDWRKTRRNYLMAKYEAVTRLGYRRGIDLLLTAASVGSILVTPKISPLVKKAIGWYRQVENVQSVDQHDPCEAGSS